MTNLARAYARDATVVALDAVRASHGAVVLVSRVAPRQLPLTPLLLVYAPRDHKENIGSTPAASFRTRVTIVIEAVLGGDTAAATDAALDDLCAAIEAALLQAPSYVGRFEQIASVATRTEYDGSGEHRVGAASIEVEVVLTESFIPNLPGTAPGADGLPEHALRQINVGIDAQNRFDPTGAYSPGYPAPRASGPDGRCEVRADLSPQQGNQS